MKKLNLNVIRIDGGTQPRERINMDAVTEYAADVKDGIEFPAVVVFHDGAEYWLADGFHRFHAHKQAGKASILADLRTGTLLDAKLHAVGANGAHGLRRSNEDKRRAVLMVLAEPAWADWSDRRIAEVCGVGHPFVAALRRPAVAEKQQENRDSSAARKTAAVESDSTPAGSQVESDSTKAPSPAAPRSASPAPAPAADDFGPSEEEIAAAQREQEDELAALRKVVEADDKLAAALAEVKRLTALNRVMEERINGLMNEKNAALAAAKSWQRKAEKAERAARQAA